MAATVAPLTRPASDEDFVRPLDAVDPDGWLRARLGASLHGRSVLCLAGGGGRQGPLCAAAGAEVTVVDLSDAMLARDRRVADARGQKLRLIQAPMHDLSALADASFDAVLQPVSTCYTPDVGAVYREVARVLRPGGVYVSQHKSPTSLQALPRAGAEGLTLATPYYHEGPLPAAPRCRTREPGTVEFLHRWEDLLGGMARAGLAIEDLREPRHDAEPGEHGRRSRYAAPYVRVLAVRRDR